MKLYKPDDPRGGYIGDYGSVATLSDLRKALAEHEMVAVPVEVITEAINCIRASRWSHMGCHKDEDLLLARLEAAQEDN